MKTTFWKNEAEDAWFMDPDELAMLSEIVRAVDQAARQLADQCAQTGAYPILFDYLFQRALADAHYHRDYRLAVEEMS